jgi:hypothetical protein
MINFTQDLLLPTAYALVIFPLVLKDSGMVELRMNEYQSEMRVFTEFLKSIYFSREE